MRNTHQYCNIFYLSRIILICVLFVIFCGACAREPDSLPQNKRVITTLFVLYDFAREIGGDHLSVRMLIPPGAEAHAYEPSPRDMTDIRQAGVFIWAGSAMEPWAGRVLAAAAHPGLVVADASQGITLLRMGEGQTEVEATDSDLHNADPHFWLDPLLAMKMVDTIRDALVKDDPDNARDYLARAAAYKEKLAMLDADFRSALAARTGSLVIYGGHNAFGYFAARYGLTFLSPYAGFSPDAEPQPKKLVDLARTMKERGLGVIYYEENVDPKVARVLAETTGAKLVLLNGAHNVTKRELQAGISYLSIMRADLAVLKEDPGLFRKD